MDNVSSAFIFDFHSISNTFLTTHYRSIIPLTELRRHDPIALDLLTYYSVASFEEGTVGRLLLISSREVVVTVLSAPSHFLESAG